MIKGVCLGNIAIDCRDAAGLQDFFAQLTGWEKREMYGCPAVIGGRGVGLLFDQADDYDYVPPMCQEQPEIKQKQMHLDSQVVDLGTAVTQAEALGAVKAASQFGGDHFVTLFDPEGHPFCLCAK